MCITLYRTIMVFWQQDARIQAEQWQKDTKIKLEKAEKAMQEMEQQLEALQQARDAVDSQARTDKKVYIAKKVAILGQTALQRDKAVARSFRSRTGKAEHVQSCVYVILVANSSD